MAKKIKKPAKGDSVNKLWETVAELVDAVNALQNIQITPTGVGKVTYADANVSFDLNVGPKC